MMKHIYLIWTAFILLLSSTAWAQSAIDTPAANIVSPVGHSKTSSVQWDTDNGTYVNKGKPWGFGVGFYTGLGPAFDLRDPAAGLSGRLGVDVHGRHVGLGFEGSFDIVWATVSAKRSDHLDQSYRVLNGGLMLVGNAYIPLDDYVIFNLGAGFGFGKRHEIYFSNYDWKCSDAAWIARLQVGGFYLFSTALTFGLNVEINFADYLKHDWKYWSDKKLDVFMGIVLTMSYELLIGK